MLRSKRALSSVGVLALIGVFLVAASSIALVISEYNRFSSGVRRGSELESLKANERLSVVQLSTIQIHVVNEGPTSSLVTSIYAVNPADRNLEIYTIDPVGVGVLGERTISLPHIISESWKVGVLTSLGNVFWESRLTMTPQDVVFTQSGLPEDTSWSVILAGEEKTSTSEKITFEDVLPGTYTWSAETPITCVETNYYAFPPSGVIPVPMQTEQLITYSEKCTLSISVNSEIAGTTDPEPGEHPYEPGSTVTVTATPYPGCEFDCWELDGEDAGSENPIHIDMGTSHTLKAVFKGQPTTVTFYVNSGLGSDVPESTEILIVETTTYTLSDLPKPIPCEVGSYISFSWLSPIDSPSAGKRYVWASTGGLSTTQTGTIGAEAGGGVVYSEYKTQYFFGVTSERGSPTGKGWYDARWTVSSSVDTPVPGDLGIQYVCVGWTGTGSAPASGSEATVSFTINKPSTVTWNWKTQYWLTMQINPSDGGSIFPTSGWFDAGSEVAISATPNENYDFGNWEGWGDGSYSGTNNPATVTMNEPITEKVNFQPKSSEVTFYELGLGGDAYGTILTVDGVGYGYSDLPKTFHWQPDSTHGFEWHIPIGAGSSKQYVWYETSGLSTQRSGTITAPSEGGSVTGKYKTQYKLVMQVSPSGGGATNPSVGSYWYDSGSSVSISATPAAGYRFVEWTGSGSGSYSGSSGSASVSMNGPITETAHFTESVMITFSTSGLGSDASGNVLKVDGTKYGYGDLPKSFEWDVSSSHNFEWYTPVGAGSGKRYAWTSTSGGITTTRSGSLTVPEGGGAVAGNYKTQYYLTMQVSPSGAGSVSPSSCWKDAGSSVEISASPCSGYAFDKWVGSGSGSYSGSSNPRWITINGPITETAYFKSAKVHVTFSVSGMGSDAYSTVLRVDSGYYSYSNLPKRFYWDVGSSHSFEWYSTVNEGYEWWFNWYAVSDSKGKFGSKLGTTTQTGRDFCRDWGSGYIYGGKRDHIGYAAVTQMYFYGSTKVTIETDDGMEVYIDGDPVFDGAAWKLQGVTKYSKTVSLSRGTHWVMVKWYEWEGGAHSCFWFTNTKDGYGPERYGWSSTSGLSSSRKGTITVPSGGGEVRASYKTNLNLHMGVDPSDGGSTNPSQGDHWYDKDKSIKVTASPNTGYEFEHWELDGVKVSSSSSYTVKMDTPHGLRAVFKEGAKVIFYDTFDSGSCGWTRWSGYFRWYKYYGNPKPCVFFYTSYRSKQYAGMEKTVNLPGSFESLTISLDYRAYVRYNKIKAELKLEIFDADTGASLLSKTIYSGSGMSSFKHYSIDIAGYVRGHSRIKIRLYCYDSSKYDYIHDYIDNVKLEASGGGGGTPTDFIYDKFGSSLDGWSYWGDSGYHLTRDTGTGQPAPSAHIYGDASGGWHHCGMQKVVDISSWTGSGALTLSFNWRAKSNYAGSACTNAHLKIYDASSGVLLYSEDLINGGTTDTGWRSYSKDISSYVSGHTRIRIVLHLSDGWSANWHQKDWYDNIRLNGMT